MHEIGMFQEALDQAFAQATAHGAQRIGHIVVRIGAESGVEPNVIAFAFDVLTRDTIAAGATLEIEPVGVVCACPQCRISFAPVDALHLCPQCQQVANIVQGREFGIATIDMA
jgi:hydrogenase nickel incorporation protein HypA/HybF